MSPAGIFATLMMALLVDGLSIFPQHWRDRVAFFLGLAAIREGWDGSPVDRYTFDLLAGWIDAAKATGNANLSQSATLNVGGPLAQAATAQIMGVLIAAVAIYTLGVLAPPSWSKKLGELAKLSWSKKGGGPGVGPPGSGGGAKFKLTTKLWLCAFLLGLMAEVPGGLIGTLVLGAVTGIVKAVSPIPNILFGVA